MNDRPLNEEAIFHIARDLKEEQKRAVYLDQVCAGDRDLRNRVEGLLEMFENQKSFLVSNNAVAETADHVPIHESEGLQIGRYKVLQRIGEGGFGVVFMAEQQTPVKRKVALKIIKPGMDTREVVARFEAERQALAMMDHTNIARVLDGGATESGRPFFVMELVKGVPITEYCDKNQLSTMERLQLFTTVCQAVQHAHQKGIIHRDLKPSNVLVTLADGRPVVKVIDFGVAKATNQQLTEKTLFTAFGQMVGTPQYMSPEQAEMSCLDVDTRSDVYSLGVLLYELLTGTTPLEAKRLRTAGYAEMQRLIREEEPPKPSTRLSTSGDQLTVIAKHRAISPDKLKRLVRGDLDWIVMKALEKDRNRRYESPASLGEDVNRALNDQPVVACPPSQSYRLQKLIRRNWLLVSTTSVITIALCGGLGLAIWGMNQAFDSARVAEKEREIAETTLLELQHNAKELALIYSLGAEFDRARAQIEIARKCGAEDSWLEFAFGQIALFEGNFKDAKSVLEKSSEATGASIPAKALLAITQLFTGRETQHLDQLLEIEEAIKDGFLIPDSAEDFFYLGFANVWANPNLALDYLRQAEQRNISGNVLPLVRAIAHTNASADESDLNGAIEFGLAAIEDAEDIEKRGLLEDSPFTSARKISAYTALAIAYIRAGDLAKGRECFQQIAGTVDKAIKKFPESADLNNFAYLYFLESGQSGKAFQFLHGLKADQLVAYLRTYRLIEYFQRGSLNDARRDLDSFEKDQQDYKYPLFVLSQLSRISDTNQLAEIRSEIKQKLEAVLQDDSGSIDHIDFYWAICRLLDLDTAGCVEEMEKRLRKYQGTYVNELLEPIIAVENHQGRLEDFKFTGDESRKRLAYTNFALGIDSLAKGEKVQANHYFNQCVDTGRFQYYVRQFSRAMRDKFEEDPNWPSWID